MPTSTDKGAYWKKLPTQLTASPPTPRQQQMPRHLPLLPPSPRPTATRRQTSTSSKEGISEAMTEVVAATGATAATAAQVSTASPTARQQLRGHLENMDNNSSSIQQAPAGFTASLATRPTNVSPTAPSSRPLQHNSRSRETSTGVDACKRGDSHNINLVYKQ